MTIYWITLRNLSSNSLALQWIFYPQHIPNSPCRLLCKYSINNPIDCECTRRKQSLITWGCTDIYEARKMNMQFWMAPMVFLNSHIREGANKNSDPGIKIKKKTTFVLIWAGGNCFPITEQTNIINCLTQEKRKTTRKLASWGKQ